MKFSLIIPTYNNPDQLKRCLRSINSQSFDNYEIIVQDDITHAGLSAMRNAGIEKAKGDYLMFVDSDDILEDGTLRALNDATIKFSEADIIEFPVVVHEGAKDEYLLSFKENTYTDLINDYWLGNKAYTHTYACNKVYKRHLFDSVRFPIGKLFEDAYTFPLLLEKTKILVTIPNGLYHYIWNKEGICAKASGKDLKQLLEAHIQTIKRWGVEKRNGFSTYFMHLLNIQIDVYKDTKEIILPEYAITYFRMSSKTFAKFIIYKIFGLKCLCKLFK